jgi:four helix bundle suffix protein
MGGEKSIYPCWEEVADRTCRTSSTYIETYPPEVAANIMVCLVHQTNYLVDRQLARLEQDFLREGGIRERMTRARAEARKQMAGDRVMGHESHGSHSSHDPLPPRPHFPDWRKA